MKPTARAGAQWPWRATASTMHPPWRRPMSVLRWAPGRTSLWKVPGITLFLKGDLLALVRARRLSKLVMRNIKQNLFFAFVYNSIGVPIAAGILYPKFGLLLSPIIAAAAIELQQRLSDHQRAPAKARETVRANLRWDFDLAAR